MVVTWVYGALSFRSLYPRWIMSISKFSKNHHYLLMKRNGGREREAENINLGHMINPLPWAHPTPTYPTVRLSDSPDISFWRAWRAVKLRVKTEFRSCFPNGSSWCVLIPGSGAPSTLNSSLPHVPYSSHCCYPSTLPVPCLWNFFFSPSSLPWPWSKLPSSLPPPWSTWGRVCLPLIKHNSDHVTSPLKTFQWLPSPWG